MQWQQDTSVGDWLVEALDDDGQVWPAVVPQGFEAYARVLHQPLLADAPEGEERPSTWSELARAFGTTVHPLVQWPSLVRSTPGEYNDVTPDGRSFTAPPEGDIDPGQLARIVAHLVGDGPTPGCASVWAGWGGLLGAYGTNGRVFFTFESEEDADPEVAHRHDQMLAQSTHDPFNNPFQRAEWQEGVLSREISEGPRLELPGRENVLFSGDIAVFRNPAWFLDVPWRDHVREAHGFPPSAQAPANIWPDDRSWWLGIEIDFQFTLIGGPRTLIDGILADDGLEAFEIAPDADLSWAGDALNG